MVVLKVYTMIIMFSAMSKWGKTITQAATMTSDTVGFSAQTIRRWAFNYVASIHEMSSVTQENITDEDIDDILSSDRGTASPCLDYLVLDEQFQNDARIFIRQNACKKGEPNLTAEMFAEWVKSVYDKEISVKTANRWLHKLGFSRTTTRKVYILMGMNKMMLWNIGTHI